MKPCDLSPPPPPPPRQSFRRRPVNNTLTHLFRWSRSRSGGRRITTLALLLGTLGFILGLSGPSPVQAASECGTLDPATEAGRSIVCTTDNYDARDDQNVFYRLPDEPPDVDYRFELEPDVKIVGQRDGTNVTAANEQDDHSRHLPRPWADYGGLFVESGPNYEGDIAVRSEADIEVGWRGRGDADFDFDNPRGIVVHHHGKAGDIHILVNGGGLTSIGHGVEAEIDSGPLNSVEDNQPRSSLSLVDDQEHTGDIHLEMTGGFVRTTGNRGNGLRALHQGGGDVRVVARKEFLDVNTPDIKTTGTNSDGIFAYSWGERFTAPGPTTKVEVMLRNFHIETQGDAGGNTVSNTSAGVLASNFNPGMTSIDVEDSRIVTRNGVNPGIFAATQSAARRGTTVLQRVPGDGSMNIRVANSTIMTDGDGGYGQREARDGFSEGADGILAWVQRSGEVVMDVQDSTIETAGRFSSPINIAHWRDDPDSTNRIQADTDLKVVRGMLVAKGENAKGISVTYGELNSGDVDINLMDTDVRSMRGDGINAFAPISGTIDIDIDGGRVVGSAAAIRLDGPEKTQPPWGRNLLTIRGGARVEGPQAVEFENRPGRLTLADSHVVGNVRFADGRHNDELQITGPGRLTGDIDFFGGTDTMTIDLAEDQHFVFDRTVISGLETLTQTGGGLVRFAESAAFTDSALTVQDGTLVLAGTLDLGDEGTLTVHQPGRLVFEVGYGSESGVRTFQHGRIFAESVHFADAPEEVSEVPSGRLFRSGRLRLANHVSQTDEEDSPVVFLQLGADLTATEQTAVRGQLAGLPLIYAAVTRGDGDEPTEVVDGQLTVQSRQADGTDQTVGHLAVDDSRVGLLTVTESAMVAPLVLPTATTTPTAPTPTSPTLPGSPAPSTPPPDPGPSDGDGQMGGTDSTPDPGDQNDGPDSAPEDRTGSDPGSGTATASSGGSGGSSSAGGVIGVGLLAALLAAFSGGDEATASAAHDTARPPSSASLATVNERGVLSLQESGQAPYRLWLRTRTGGPSLAMTGAAKAGVDGTEVGLRLEGAGQFHTGFSVAPTVTAQVDSLHLTAEGAVYAWNSGWRSDRYFAGLRLSHGDFEVHSRIANPMVNGALRSQARLRNTQAQLQVGGHFHAGALRFTPSAAIRMGTFAQREHVAQSPVLRARVPAVTQDYTSYQFGMQMTPDRWLDGSGGRWQPQLRWDTIRTHARGSETLQLHQSDTLGAVSFPSRASIRDLPAVVHSLSLGARVQPGGNDRTTWQFGFAGLEADGETHYAALATYRVRF